MVQHKHRKRKSRSLFDRGIAALSGLPYEPGRGYLCPVCLQQYAIQDVTEEHVPPKSLEGTVLCLTCRSCNSTAGHQLDAASLSFRHSLGFMQPTGVPYDARLTVAGTTVNVAVTRNGTGTSIAVSKHNDPQKLQAVMESMASLGSGSSLQIAHTARHTRRLAETGFLRMGYLAAFAKFGYRSILSSAWNPVRQQILEPRSSAFIPHCAYIGREMVQGRYLLFVDAPLPCLGVQIDSTMVFLPWGETTTATVSAWLTQGRDAGGRCSIVGRGPLPWPIRMEMQGDFAESQM